jgi:hypothetical protein
MSALSNSVSFSVSSHLNDLPNQPLPYPSQGATEAEGLEAARDAAPSFLRQRLPSPSSTATSRIPFSDDSSPRAPQALPAVSVRWDRLAPKDEEAEASTTDGPASELETQLGVLGHVVHGGLFRQEHFEEVVEMLRVKWDRSEEEQQQAEA